MSTTTKKDRQANARAKAQAAVEQLNAGVEQLVGSDEWKNMLATAVRFHRYSFGNIMLITIQRPDATTVAGYRKWQSMGRQVRKGEQAIRILAPQTGRCRDCDGTGEADGGACARCKGSGRWMRFTVASVFDVAQTDPSPGHPDPYEPTDPRVLLDGDDPEGLYDRVRQVLEADGWTVELRHDAEDRTLAGGANGWCAHDRKLVVVSADRAPAQQAKTIVHEWAHAILHGPGVLTPRGVKETEAESTAYVVCQALGMDTDDYSFPYVAGWAQGNVEQVKQAGQRVIGTATAMLDRLAPADDDIPAEVAG